jgi:hypothetical protein
MNVAIPAFIPPGSKRFRPIALVMGVDSEFHRARLFSGPGIYGK